MIPTDRNVLQTLGYVYRRAGQTNKAVERFEEGLAQSPHDNGLLVNLTSALIESGRFADARKKLELLLELTPADPRLPGLRAVLEDAETRGGEPPQLVVRIPTSAAHLWIQCSKCEARVPLTGERDMLCGRCGSVLPGLLGPCPYCTSDGRVLIVAGAATQCPYCRDGQISVTKPLQQKPRRSKTAAKPSS
jgi:tetratricopeptide (TPR) repeat protein